MSAAEPPSRPDADMATMSPEELRRRLEVATEWTMRLQDKIQELAGFTQNDTRRLRQRIESPDLAIPLLQCYDVALLEKDDEIAALKRDNVALLALVEQCHGRGSPSSGGGLLGAVRDASSAPEAEERARLAEEVLGVTQKRARDEIGKANHRVQLMEHEVASLQRELAGALERESKSKLEADGLRARTKGLEDARTRLEEECASLTERLRASTARVQQATVEAQESRQQAQAAVVQLDLAHKENDDKLLEVERLRERMVLALRQGSENHAQHLKLVEQKHLRQVEDYKMSIKALELEVAKQRAQLARAGTVLAGSVGAATGAGGAPTTVQLLDAQQRQSQESELQRLYRELSAAQLQRDDAQFRYEQLSSSLRRERESFMHDSRAEIELLKQKLAQARARGEELEGEFARLREQLRQAKEASATHAVDLLALRREKESGEKRLQEAAREARGRAEELEQRLKERAESVELERRRQRQLEQSLEQAQAKLQQTKEAHHQEQQRAEEKITHLLETHQETSRRLEQLQAQWKQKQREVEAGATKMDFLLKSITGYQKQVQQYDERLQAYEQSSREKTTELQRATVLIEQLKMEHGRVRKDRDRLAEGMMNYVY